MRHVVGSGVAVVRRIAGVPRTAIVPRITIVPSVALVLRIAIVFLCLLSAARSHADYDRGLEALDRWDYPRAVAAFDAAAAKGDARALVELADIAHPTYGLRDPARQVALLERAAAAGDPRGQFKLAEIILRSRELYRREGVKLEGEGGRVMQLLASSCEHGWPHACVMLAEIHSVPGDPKRDPPGLPTAADAASARRWGDIWRVERLRRAEQGDRDAIVDLGLYGGKPWAGLAPDARALFSVLTSYELGSKPRPDPGMSEDALHAAVQRADRWEIAHGLRPRELPAPQSMAARIAAHYAFLEKPIDADLARALANLAPALHLAYGGVRRTADTRWPPLEPLARTLLPAVETFHRTVARAARARGLDTQAAIGARLAKELTPRQLWMLLQLHEKPGARKLPEMHRLLTLAVTEGSVVVTRLHRDPKMASQGADLRARVARYAADNGAAWPSATGEASLATRREFMERFARTFGAAPFGASDIPLVETAAVSGRSWARLLGAVRQDEGHDIGRIMSCGPCRIIVETVRGVAAERRRLQEVRDAEDALATAVDRAVRDTGVERFL